MIFEGTKNQFFFGLELTRAGECNPLFYVILCQESFLIHRRLRLMNQKALRAGCALRGEEVCCKQHRSGEKESQATLCSVSRIRRINKEYHHGNQP